MPTAKPMKPTYRQMGAPSGMLGVTAPKPVGVVSKKPRIKKVPSNPNVGFKAYKM